MHTPMWTYEQDGHNPGWWLLTRLHKETGHVYCEHDAAFIVRAVNAHERLIELCRQVVLETDSPVHGMPPDIAEQARTLLAELGS